MVAPALIAGAAALGSAGINFFGQRKANKAGIANSREQMAFQERMSSTAYQRALDDARKAGLNPLLMGKYGGASTPGGAMFSPDSETTGAVSSALEARRMYSEIENLDMQNQKLDSDTRLADAQIGSIKAATAMKVAEMPGQEIRNKAYNVINEVIESATGRGTPDNFFTKVGNWIGKNVYDFVHLPDKYGPRIRHNPTKRR